MKELDVLIEALKKKNVIKNIQKTVNIVPVPDDTPDDKRQELVNKGIEVCLLSTFEHDEEMCDLYARYCNEIGIKTLIRELGIVPDPNYKPTTNDVIASLLAELFD